MSEKLIRDLIPAIAQAQGRTLALRRAGEEELTRLLGLKLVEETHEVLDAVSSGVAHQVLDELADVQTVLEEVASRYGFSKEDLDRRVVLKRTERGGFRDGLVLRDVPLSASRLHVGGSRSLVDALRREFEQCCVARIAVAFVMDSGLDLIEGPALAALLRGAEVRLLTTDYLGVTEPRALRRLLRWQGRFEPRIYSHPRRSYHPKAYLFERADGSGRAFIGSANLSRMGLMEGVEWTWSVLDVDAGQPMHELRVRFEELFEAPESRALEPHWIADYELRRPPQPLPETSVQASDSSAGIYEVDPQLEPREVQRLALIELERLRNDGERRALVVAATGLGKTFLAAFDAKNAERVLFVAHREELLRQAHDTFAQVYPTRSRGYVLDGRAELDREIVLASIQTLTRPNMLSRPELQRFDYVVIDEFHHAAAESYQRLLAVISPRFLLGLTATPFRSDNRDLLSLCDGNLAYQVGLFEAMSFGWLVPFRYYGLADVVRYDDTLLNSNKTYDTARLTLRVNTAERAELVLRHFKAHPSQAALGFCVSIAHAEFMAQAFRDSGIAAAAVHSGAGSLDRSEAIKQLGSGQFRILFTVDLFNEGVDIPSVDLVLFLRPTESMTIFLQQLGRGLRLHKGKSYLTVLDFIANYRNAHVKLPLLVGQSDGSEPRKAIQVLKAWQETGQSPPGIPDGVEVHIEPVAMNALRDSLRRASPLRELVLHELTELAPQLGQPPSLLRWQQRSAYSLSTACTALGVDRWHQVLAAASLLTEEQKELEQSVGEVLKEIERTQMSKSYKMVLLGALCEGRQIRRAISMAELVQAYRSFFAQDRHREDVLGSEVEDAMTVPASKWEALIRSQPIHALIGGNTGRVSMHFAYSDSAREFRYIGPAPTDPQLSERFAEALRDRIAARLHAYWQRPGPGRFVFSVIPGGQTPEPGLEPLRDSEADEPARWIVMFGTGAQRDGLPSGWHLVAINGQHWYGKFAKVALNVLKAEPTDSRKVPNQLSNELTALFGGQIPKKPKVRLVRQAGAAVWEIQRA